VVDQFVDGQHGVLLEQLGKRHAALERQHQRSISTASKQHELTETRICD
jgi:hypothetical protein